jgi:hypothetical protein
LALASAFNSHPDPIVEAKIVDLRDKFRDAFAGWLEIEEAACLSKKEAAARRS